MPLSAGLIRKPSTCSLPTALLVEKGMTPSSSYEGLSPASSTCSLDMINLRGNTPVHSHRYPALETERHSRSESSAVENSPVLANVDAAIVKAVPSLPHAKMNGDVPASDRNMSGDKPQRVVSGSMSPQNPATVPKLHNRHSGSSDTSRSGAKSSGSMSWADQVVPSEESIMINRPGWAQMSTANGEVRLVSSPGELQHNIHLRGQVPSSAHQFVANSPLHQQHHPNTSPHVRHGSAAKRNSTEGYNTSIIQVPSTPDSLSKHIHRESSPSPVIKVPQPVLPQGSVPVTARNVQMPLNTTNWPTPMRQFLLPNSVSLVRASRPQAPPTAVYTPYTTSTTVVNGLIRTPPPHHVNRIAATPAHVFTTGGYVSYPPLGLPAHSQSPPTPPVACFNCGKRGHLGTACPGETMETNNPEGTESVYVFHPVISLIPKLCSKFLSGKTEL